MSGGAGIIIRDDVSPTLTRLKSTAQKKRLKHAIGFGVTQLVREHFYDLNSERANRLGGRRSNFYARAGDSTSYQLTGHKIQISTRQIGILLRYYGGTIRPKKKGGRLTIALIAEAYGKRAREFEDLAPIVTGTPGVLILAKTGKGYFIPYYLLVPEATHKPDQSVFPTDEEILKTAQFHAGRAFDKSLEN